MSDIIRFQGDGQTCLWKLPWTLASAGDLVLTITRPGGLTRALDPDGDYSVLGNVLMCEAEAGSSICCWPRQTVASAAAGPATGQAGASQDVAAYGASSGATAGVDSGASVSGPVYQARALDEATASLESLAASLREHMREELAADVLSGLAEIRAKLETTLAEGLAELEKARKRGRDEARLAFSPVGQREILKLPNGAAQGSWLTLPVSYLPGANNLQIFQDGLLLRPGADYEESGVQNEASSTIRVLIPLQAGAALDCVVRPIGDAEHAATAAREAQQAQAMAASLVASANAAQADAASFLARSGSDAITAQGWANASQKSANDAWEASCHAWDAATQASIHSRRPGICAVKDKADIHACSPGLFIINPHITHAPTPFFGVWPASGVDEMLWDGVFFLGGKPWPPDPELPPRCPERPAPDPVAARGAADAWIPCDHQHPQAPPSCGCCPSLCPGKANIGTE